MITIHVMQNLTNETTAVIFLIKVPLYPLHVSVCDTRRENILTRRESGIRSKISQLLFDYLVWNLESYFNFW
jgi:hypothetical protein